MPAPRYLLPDEGIYHVTSRAVAGLLLFGDDGDRRFLSARLRAICLSPAWGGLHAWCFVGTHYHLVIESTLASLSTGMKTLNYAYARWSNARRGRKGHVFEERFAAWVIRDEEHLEAACEYVLANAARAGLCETPDDWPWCGLGLPPR